MKRLLCSAFIVATVALGAIAQKPDHKATPLGPPKQGPEAITADGVLGHIKELASDKFEGRRPGTRGEELAINYIADQFKKIGLAPGNTDGSYFQDVPLVGIAANKDAELKFKTPGKDMKLRFGDDFIAWTKRAVEKSTLDADMVFVGYGVVAPEYNWNDYKDVDVHGKLIVMLVSDPPIPDRENPKQLDPKMFGGKAMTYYGRWTYKFEIAAQKGAAGALIVHETGPAGYPWEVVRGSWSNEQSDLVAKDNNMSRVAVEGWITNEKARALFNITGLDLDALKRAAIRKDFKPVDLHSTAHLTIENKIRRIGSHNVIGKLEGSDPKLKDQYVIYTAHWDHFGIGEPNAKGDKIYNGALDNASGCAGLLEMAHAFKALPKPPRRSILFISVTAEEQGLIGSRYYAQNPIYPLEKTVAEINMDGLNQWGRTRDVTVIGLGSSTLDDVLALAAREKGRMLRPDAEPEKGFYYRSDHFEFAKVGVPALDPEAGIDYIGKPAGWGLKKRDEYTEHDYHKPSDEIKPDWDLSGAVDDLRLLMTVGYRVANTASYPEWKPGKEFKARREEMLHKAGIE